MPVGKTQASGTAPVGKSSSVASKQTKKNKPADALITDYPNDDLSKPSPVTALEKRAERSLSREENKNADQKSSLTSSNAPNKKNVAGNWQDMGKVSLLLYHHPRSRSNL